MSTKSSLGSQWFPNPTPLDARKGPIRLQKPPFLDLGPGGTRDGRFCGFYRMIGAQPDMFRFRLDGFPRPDRAKTPRVGPDACAAIASGVISSPMAAILLAQAHRGVLIHQKEVGNSALGPALGAVSHRPYFKVLLDLLISDMLSYTDDGATAIPAPTSAHNARHNATHSTA